MTLLSMLFLSVISFAQTRVAFIEIRDKNGNLHQLEPGGRFAHIAISYHGQWLHTHPYYGVELIDTATLEKMGLLTFVEIPRQAELTTEELQKYLGRPYDHGYSWESEGYYCSKLVGKILQMKPEPMHFTANAWKHPPRAAQLSAGLSPDDIFRQILTRHYQGKIILRCETIFH